MNQAHEGEELAETLARLQSADFELPFEAKVPADLGDEQKERAIGVSRGRGSAAAHGGSFEITEILKQAVRDGAFVGAVELERGGRVSSMSSPFGASFGRERGFRMHVNAELIIYGGTEPNARVRIDGNDITLDKDGNFSYHFVLPDGQFHIPIEATSADKVEMRSALLSFLRMTTSTGEVKKTGQPEVDEPFGKK